MVLLNNTADGGTNGTAVTIGNSGGASGSAWDAVTLASDGTVTYDSAHAYSGTLSTKYLVGAVGGSTYTLWSTSLTATSVPTVWFRAYCWFTGVVNQTPLIFAPRAGASFCGGVNAQQPGANFVLAAQDNNAVTQATGTVAIAVNQWVRVEGFVTGSATVGQIEFKLFNSPASTTPSETITSAATLNTGGALTALRVGMSTLAVAPTNGSYWLDSIAVSDTGYIGPEVVGGTPIVYNYQVKVG